MRNRSKAAQQSLFDDFPPSPCSASPVSAAATSAVEGSSEISDANSDTAPVVDPQPVVVASTSTSSMFGIRDEHLRPIREVAVKMPVHAGQDMDSIGSWGILFLCCGAMAGQSLSWKATVASSIDTGLSAQMRLLAGKPVAEHLAIVFRGHVKEWSSDPYAGNTALSRMSQMSRPFAEKHKDIAVIYLILAIVLNSFPAPADEELATVWKWAQSRPHGWQALFFAVGLLLSDDQEFPWEKMGSALLGMAQTMKPQVQALFDRYSRLR